MIRLLADENFNNTIVRGVLRRKPDLDIVRVQDVGLSSLDDPAILEWAARERRMLLTHDTSTVPHFLYQRVDLGKYTPGVIVARSDIAVNLAIEEILLLVECSLTEEWDGRVIHIPL